MAQEIQSQYGKIVIREEVIATVSGVAAMECYGLVGMAPRNVQEELTDLLRRENFERGVDVQFGDDSISIQLYIVVEYGVKTMMGLKVNRVNVKVQSVRVTSAKRK